MCDRHINPLPMLSIVILCVSAQTETSNSLLVISSSVKNYSNADSLFLIVGGIGILKYRIWFTCALLNYLVFFVTPAHLTSTHTIASPPSFKSPNTLASLILTQKYCSFILTESSYPYCLHFGKQPVDTVPCTVQVYDFLSRSSLISFVLCMIMSVLAKLISITSLRVIILVPNIFWIGKSTWYIETISSYCFSSW